MLQKAVSPCLVRNNNKNDNDKNSGYLFILKIPSALILPNHEDNNEDAKDQENKTNIVLFPPLKTFLLYTALLPKLSTNNQPLTPTDKKLLTPAVCSNVNSPLLPPTTNWFVVVV